MKTVLHILPTIPPVINGVGDFGFLLAEAMAELGYSNNIFLVKKLPDSSTVNKVEAFNAHNLYQKINDYKPQTVVLHYANYAYQAKGLPFHLVSHLKKAKAVLNCKVIIYFHELYSSSNSVFKISFYTNFLQKYILNGLYSMADHTFTNCDLYQQLLYKAVKGKQQKNTVTGIFSNIAEDWFKKSISKDDEALVVFGSAQRRKKLYDNPKFKSIIQKLGVSKVYDIGSGQMGSSNEHVLFHATGAIPAKEVASYLNKARFGAIDYVPQILGKSGILSAYAAFGVIPVNFNEGIEELHDGLKENFNYLNLNSSLPPVDVETMKNDVLNWYKPRNRFAIAKEIARYL